jgi:hypothetical protein
MRFTVVWKPSALNDLASLWAAAAPGERKTITDAADRIDGELLNDPAAQGESRPGDRRILFALPLAIVFDVNEPDRIVNILSVHRVRHGSRP